MRQYTTMIESNYENIKASARREVEEVQRNYDRLYANYSNLQEENTSLLTSNATLHRENESLKSSARLASEAGFGVGANPHTYSLNVTQFLPNYSTSAVPAPANTVRGPASSAAPIYTPFSAPKPDPAPPAPLTVATGEPQPQTGVTGTTASFSSPSKFSFSTYDLTAEAQSDPFRAPSAGPEVQSESESDPVAQSEVAVAPVHVPPARSRYYTGAKSHSAAADSGQRANFNTSSTAYLASLVAAAPARAPLAAVPRHEGDVIPPDVQTDDLDGKHFTLQEICEDTSLFPGPSVSPPPSSIQKQVHMHMQQRQLLTPGSSESDAEAEESVVGGSALRDSLFE